MQDSREIDYFGQRILQIVQPIAAGEDRQEVLSLLAQSVANNFAADGCWILQYGSPGIARVVASACVNHRTNAATDKLHTFELPKASTPVLWKMPTLPDYQVMAVETRNGKQVTGCLLVATKGVEWYRETKLVFQIVADYVGAALIEADLHVQAQIAQLYPQLHYQLTQAIVENKPVERLFEIAVADMVEALQLKRGFVLTLKTSELPKQNPETVQPKTGTSGFKAESGIFTDNQFRTGKVSTLTRIGAETTNTLIQLVTTIDVRKGTIKAVPPSFFLENSRFCKIALANAPNPTVFDGNERATSTDRLIFQDDLLPSIAMIPLIGTAHPDRPPSESVWGWLVLQTDRSRHWHRAELNLLQCQIYQIALARIQNTSLRNARNAIASRTSQVQTSIQIQTKLHEAGRKRMEKLRQANELKDEFISTISHELRTPLTSMSLAIKMLRQVDVDPARREQYLDILEEQCQREIKLVNDILKLQQLESHQLEYRPQLIALNQFVSEQATLVAERWSDRKALELSLNLPQVSPQLETEADSLKHIVEELLVNAGKFAIPKTTVEVWVTIEPSAAVLQVSNLSKPIATEDLPYLFEKFRRGTGMTQQAISGTGLGLALVKSMVEHIQGTIVVTSEPVEKGIAKTTFTLTIPTALEHH